MTARPYLRWAGGKTQLLPQILPLLPKEIPVYRSVCFGAGALFFRLAAEGRSGVAHLTDLNWRLIAAHRAVRDSLDQVVGMLGLARDTPEEYARARATLNRIRPGEDDVVVGALVLQLNRTSFNGLWRENSSGGYNSTYGGDGAGAPVLDAAYETRLIAARAAFLAARAQISAADFGEAVLAAESGDFIDADPPYLPREGGSFTSYVGGSHFGEVEHRQLAACLATAGARGARFLLSSSDTPLAREIYGRIGEVAEVQARRAINSDGAGRGRVGELLVRNY